MSRTLGVRVALLAAALSSAACGPTPAPRVSVAAAAAGPVLRDVDLAGFARRFDEESTRPRLVLLLSPT